MVNGEWNIESRELLGMVGPFGGLDYADKQLNQLVAALPEGAIEFGLLQGHSLGALGICVPCHTPTIQTTFPLTR